MYTELVSLEKPTIPLDGLFYRPSQDHVSTRIALIFHGNTMNFYTGVARFLPPVLVAAGYAVLSFNRRSHDILGILNSRDPVGAACQATEEDFEDNGIAAAWAVARGYSDQLIIGHSNGGTLAVHHATRSPHTRAMVLFSAHAGRSQAQKTGWLAGASASDIIQRAKDLVAKGRGRELILLPDFWYVSTAASILDRIGPALPDILELAPEVQCPVLTFRASTEPDTLFPIHEFQRLCRGQCTAHTIEDTDHFYKNAEDYVGAAMIKWLGSARA
jgi:pimeloyl-ACP methyl ester carboxylesterase